MRPAPSPADQAARDGGRPARSGAAHPAASRVLLCAVLLGRAAFVPAQPVAAGAPKYRLEPGQQLTYQYRVQVRPLADAAAPAERLEQLNIWCLQATGGHVRLLLESAATGADERAGGLVVEIDPTGRRRLSEEAVLRLPAQEHLLDVIPALPLGVQLLPEWSTPPDPLGRTWRSRLAGGPGIAPGSSGADTVQIAFVVEDLPAAAAAWGLSRRGTIWFDRERGLVARFESEQINARLGQLSRVDASVQETRTHPQAWVARRVAEAEQFERLLAGEDRLYGEIGLRPAEVEQILDQLDRLWTGFASQIEERSGSPFARLAAARRRQLRHEADGLRARATLGLRWLNLPARAWTLQNSAGETVTSESIRRGVVMEVFWSTESLAGVRVLGSLQHLRTQPPPHSWPVLCFNVDRHLPQAQQAIAAVAPRDAHLLAGPLADLDALPEVPVVRVVDAAGVVRGVWVGWQPDYPAARALTVKLIGSGSRR